MIRFALTQMLDEEACYNYLVAALQTPYWLALSDGSRLTTRPSSPSSHMLPTSELPLSKLWQSLQYL